MHASGYAPTLLYFLLYSSVGKITLDISNYCRALIH